MRTLIISALEQHGNQQNCFGVLLLMISVRNSPISRLFRLHIGKKIFLYEVCIISRFVLFGVVNSSVKSQSSTAMFSDSSKTSKFSKIVIFRQIRQYNQSVVKKCINTANTVSLSDQQYVHITCMVS
jgi:hypothetical protein